MWARYWRPQHEAQSTTENGDPTSSMNLGLSVVENHAIAHAMPPNFTVVLIPFFKLAT
jgi:hypothetical protein